MKKMSIMIASIMGMVGLTFMGFWLPTNLNYDQQETMGIQDDIDQNQRYLNAVRNGDLVGVKGALVAGADDVVPDLAPAVAPLARKGTRDRGEITVRTVDGADHFFRDLYNEDAADLIAEWIKG